MADGEEVFSVGQGRANEFVDVSNSIVLTSFRYESGPTELLVGPTTISDVFKRDMPRELVVGVGNGLL
jgi:hypothetical protein